MQDMDGLRLVALAARDAFRHVEARFGRREATPDKTVEQLFFAAKAVEKILERAERSPFPAQMRCILGRHAAEVEGRSGGPGAVNAAQIKTATAVLSFLKAHGWREGADDDRKMDAAVRIMVALQKEFPEVINLPDAKHAVRCLPDYIQGPFWEQKSEQWFCYYRRGAYRVPLRGQIGSAEFMAAYRAAHRALSDPNRVEQIAA